MKKSWYKRILSLVLCAAMLGGTSAAYAAQTSAADAAQQTMSQRSSISDLVKIHAHHWRHGGYCKCHIFVNVPDDVQKLEVVAEKYYGAGGSTPSSVRTFISYNQEVDVYNSGYETDYYILKVTMYFAGGDQATVTKEVQIYDTLFDSCDKPEHDFNVLPWS